MVQRNYSALVQGLKFYTDAMRRFVKQRLVAAFPNNWWEQGVMAVVSDNQRSNLRRDAANDPRRDKADLLEPYHFVPVVTRHFDRAFADVFHNYSKTRSLLQQVAIARNNSAHPPSGDMLADDVAHALYAVVQVLSAAQLPEAEAVENIRKDVMGIPEPAPPPPDSRFTPRPEPKTPLAEDVRRVVIDEWITPARNRGEREVSIVSGEVHKQLGWLNRNPSVCSALSDRRGELARRASVELIDVEGPNPSSTTKFVYRLL